VSIFGKFQASNDPLLRELGNLELGQTMQSLESKVDAFGLTLNAEALADHRHGCMFDVDAHLVSASRFLSQHIAQGMSREELMDKMESKTVFTTLLHELGHNFGLRHNFHGSFDEANFH